MLLKVHLKTLDLNYDCQGRTAESEKELILFGFVNDLINERIRKSAEYFKEGFISLQCDVWTSQSLLSVLGISVSFFDVLIQNKITLFLCAQPLPSGKKAVLLEDAIRKCLERFGLKLSYFAQGVADAEGAVQNCLVSLLSQSKVYVCLCHELATLTRPVFQCAAKPYKLDYCDDLYRFFARIKRLITFFRMAPKKMRQLKRLQHGKSKVTLLQWSTTRWDGALFGLARINRLRTALIEYFVGTSEKYDATLPLSEADWKVIPELLVMLFCVHKTTKFLQYKEVCIFSMRPVLLNNLRAWFQHLKEGKEQKISIDETVVQCKVRTRLGKLALNRFLEQFDERFGNELKLKSRDADFERKHKEKRVVERLDLFLDPRTRNYSVSCLKASLLRLFKTMF